MRLGGDVYLRERRRINGIDSLFPISLAIGLTLFLASLALFFQLYRRDGMGRVIQVRLSCARCRKEVPIRDILHLFTYHTALAWIL